MHPKVVGILAVNYSLFNPLPWGFGQSQAPAWVGVDRGEGNHGQGCPVVPAQNTVPVA
jgi:hypothetical protein